MKPNLTASLSLVCLMGVIFEFNPASAQVTPDGTTSTTVNVEGNNFEINNGDRAGNNLFHSFQDFSVPTGGEAFFNNATDITNILSRVTGGNISNINGLIRASGSANLFLINPAGIIFGEGASLDLGGAFLGSTADSILFPEGEFSAVDLDNPPLLTINAPIGLSFRDNPSPINIQDFQGILSLEVKSGQNLALVGGEVNATGIDLDAPGGNIEIGGLAEAGIVELNNDGSLTFPDNIAKADISFEIINSIGVTGENGGNVTFNARNLFFQGTGILAGIGSDMGSPDAQAGDIEINATDTITFDSVVFFNRVRENAMGNGGNINLTAPSISFQNSGDSSVFSLTTSTSGQGNAGDINITTNSLSLNDGFQIESNTSGQGDAGNITINATENVSIDGIGITESLGLVNVSSVSSIVEENGLGNGGNITINTPTLSISNGGRVSASTFGQGNAGNITINATDSISIEGAFIDETRDLNVPSSIDSGVDQSATGNGGVIDISTTNLSLTNGGFVNVSTFGQGNGGSVEITASNRITIDGENSDGNPSFVASGVASGAVGDGGRVSISTSNLNLTNGGFVIANTQGEGNGGSVEITASDRITIDDGGVVSQVTPEAVGDGGRVSITNSNLNLTNGGVVSADTFGEGNAGDLTINATESIAISGVTENSRSGLFANALISSGTGGNVNVFTDQLTIDHGGTIEASNFDSLGDNEPGTGEPGNINIQANSLSLSNEARIDAATQSETGNTANIDLKLTEDLTLRNNSFISARAFQEANGGSLDIDARFIIAFPDGNNDIIANAQRGNGGNINITAESLFGIEERPLNPNTNDINASSQFGLDGTISIFTPDVNSIQTETQLPTNPIETEQTTAQACQSDRLAGKSGGLIVKGKGGIPPEPIEPIDSDAITVNGQFTNPNPQVQSRIIKPVKTSMGDIYPARGIIKTEDGQVILTAYSTDGIDPRTPYILVNCDRS
ncbi:MAG: filamentous hemagglutinin N-terminal domain-containing protein [Pleurocapsa sp. MO_226.B13]|nr:filamentous hemagglutinin N-terminal domain-containing protein [Pleurocapsa sp. MO_226.B13]